MVSWLYINKAEVVLLIGDKVSHSLALNSLCRERWPWTSYSPTGFTGIHRHVPLNVELGVKPRTLNMQGKPSTNQATATAQQSCLLKKLLSGNLPLYTLGLSISDSRSLNFFYNRKTKQKKIRQTETWPFVEVLTDKIFHLIYSEKVWI